MLEIFLAGFESLDGLLSHYIERNASVFYRKCYIVTTFFGLNQLLRKEPEELT